MKYVQKILKLVKNILLSPLYFFSFVFPRNKKIWLFGSQYNSFLDNSKYFFWYVADNYSKQIKAVWISGDSKMVKKIRKNGYNCYYKWSLKGLWYCLRGSVYIYSFRSSDINFWTSGGALRINLWHGIPLKTIEFDIKIGKAKKIFNSHSKYFYMMFYPDIYQKHHYILSTSSEISKIFASAFRISIEKCLEFGYPRCEHLLWDKDKILQFAELKDREIFNFIKGVLLNYDKCVIYMPTFREQGENDIAKLLDLNYLNTLFKSKNWLLLIKPHPSIRSKMSQNFSNIIFLQPKTDVYMILPFTHLLITDYSSIMFDYLLTGNPIILYQYDLDSYLNSEREFYEMTAKLNVGIRVFSKEELYKQILNILSKSNCEKFFKEEVVAKLWGRLPLKANEKLYGFI
ncbi:MAG: CDP-glycerol glycerophosphotransferase family protein, partial [Candidatus Aenigmatarchaeota archaeon]